jgi:hypothetical protein
MTRLAESYIKEKFPFRELVKFRKVDEQESFFRRVAMTYENVHHAPNDPDVKAAYDALKEEVVMQFEYMVNSGIQVNPFLKEGQPYQDSAEMMREIASTDMLYVFLTKNGYGTPGHLPPPDHPMLEYSGIEIDGTKFCYNDVLRAVHDYYCHYLFKTDFSVTGECMAALAHLSLFSKTAGLAAFSEVVGQICWFYYGTHLLDDALRIPKKGSDAYMPLGIRPYPGQKAVILPKCLMTKLYSNVS